MIWVIIAFYLDAITNAGTQPSLQYLSKELLLVLFKSLLTVTPISARKFLIFLNILCLSQHTFGYFLSRVLPKFCFSFISRRITEPFTLSKDHYSVALSYNFGLEMQAARILSKAPNCY